MGDRRFDAAYRTLTETRDRPAVLRAMPDEAVVHALAAASRKMDAYLANVLAVELLNRQRRKRAVTVGLIAGLAGFIILRTAILLRAELLRTSDGVFVLGSLAALLGGTAIGLGAAAWMARRG